MNQRVESQRFTAANLEDQLAEIGWPQGMHPPTAGAPPGKSSARSVPVPRPPGTR